MVRNHKKPSLIKLVPGAEIKCEMVTTKRTKRNSSRGQHSAEVAFALLAQQPQYEESLLGGESRN